MAATSKREIVLQRHNADQESAKQFINQQWPKPKPGDKIDMNSFITYAVSTSLGVSVLLIAKGLRSMFTRNSYSADPSNPWLIFQHAEENGKLAEHVQGCRDNMDVQSQDGRTEVDKIAAHVLYQWKGNNWIRVPTTSVVGDDNVVRFIVGDIEIWSHPARVEALTRVLDGIEGFNRVKGDLNSSIRSWLGMRDDPKIPQNAKQAKREQIKRKFSELYSFYQNLSPVPNSYQFPTLQLGQRRDDGKLQRYGDTSAGVDDKFANKVHEIFPAPNVEPRPLPSQNDVYNLHVEEPLSFEDMMN